MSRPERELRRNREELAAFADQWPYAAVTGANTRVPRAYEDVSVSRITGQDVRMWRFRTAEQRDEFVLDTPFAEKAGKL